MVTSNSYERLTVNLTQKASAALLATAEREELNRTDVVNRALQLYEYVSKLRDNGGELLARETPGGDVMLMRLI